MSKASEILEKFAGDHPTTCYKSHALQAMEAYALACLEKAAESAKVKRTFVDTSGKEVRSIAEKFEPNAFSYTPHKESITSKENLT